MFGLTLFKVLKIQLLDELGQGQFPGLLLGVGQTAELLGIQPQLPGHLDVGMGKAVALPRLNPRLILLWYLLLYHGSPVL